MHETYIIDNYELETDVFFITIPRIIDFKAGQVVRLKVNDIQPRIYSISSGAQEDKIGILYNVKDDGLLTPVLSKLSQGDKIEISDAFGDFTDDNKASCWIATGTGIAPFYSMFKSGIYHNKTLIHGGRGKTSFYFEDEFKKQLNEKYIRCCSREHGTGLFHGKVTQYLADQKYLSPNQKYYLCGSAEMVVETRDLLISKQIPYSNIKAEIYF